MSPDRAWPFLSDPSHPFLSAVWAVAIHGVIGVFVIAPIIWRSRHRTAYAALAFAGGSVLDLDHFIAAGSISLHTIETLPGGRPDSHSIVFVLALALLVLAITRSVLGAWSVFAVNLAHLLFDGAGGSEHILYPWTHVDGVPWLLSPAGCVVLLGASVAIARRADRSGPQVHGRAQAGVVEQQSRAAEGEKRAVVEHLGESPETVHR